MGFDFNVKYHETPKSSIVLTKPMLICWKEKKSENCLWFDKHEHYLTAIVDAIQARIQNMN